MSNHGVESFDENMSTSPSGPTLKESQTDPMANCGVWSHVAGFLINDGLEMAGDVAICPLISAEGALGI